MPQSFVSLNAKKQGIGREIDRCRMCFFRLPYTLHSLHQIIQQEESLPLWDTKDQNFLYPPSIEIFFLRRQDVILWAMIEIEHIDIH